KLLEVQIIYSARYHIDIGLHVFPTEKYHLTFARIVDSGIVSGADVIEPRAASWDDLALVHTPEYLARLREGTMTAEDVAQLELPWSAEMVEGFRVMVGGTVAAGLMVTSLEVRSGTSEVGIGRPDFRLRTSNFRVVCHLGGGLHHAFPNHGEGFCPFNDVAVAVRAMERRGI